MDRSRKRKLERESKNNLTRWKLAQVALKKKDEELMAAQQWVNNVADVVQMLIWSGDHGWHRTCNCDDCKAVTTELMAFAAAAGLEVEDEEGEGRDS